MFDGLLLRGDEAVEARGITVGEGIDGRDFRCLGLGGDVLEFEPGAVVGGVAVEDGVGAVWGGGELQQNGGAAGCDGMEMEVAEGIVGVGSGEKLFAVGEPVEIRIAVGPIVAFVGERVEIVGKLPGVGESVAVGIAECWGIGASRGGGCGVPVEGFVTELMADDALDGVTGGIGLGGPWGGVGVVDFIGEDIGDEAEFRAWSGLGSVRHEEADGFAAVIEAAVEGAEDGDAWGELIAGAEGMEVIEIQGGIKSDHDEEAVRWQGGVGWEIEAHGTAQTPGKGGEFGVEEGDGIGGEVMEFDELIAGVVLDAEDRVGVIHGFVDDDGTDVWGGVDVTEGEGSLGDKVFGAGEGDVTPE
jgi:hypothetical protein